MERKLDIESEIQRDRFIEYMKDDIKTLKEHSEQIGITQHTLINFIQRSTMASRIVITKIKKYLEKEGVKE